MIRKHARRSLLTLAVTAAMPLGAQASPYLNLPTFSCGGTGGNALQSINWGDGIALNGPGTPPGSAAPSQSFDNCTSGRPSTGWVSTGWVSTGWVTTGWVSADSFKIDFGVPSLPAVQKGWIDLKWDSLSTETYKENVDVVVGAVDPTAVEYVTDFGLKLDVYLKDSQTGLETLAGSDWVGVQVLSMTDYVTGASLSVDPKLNETTQDLVFNASLPGGSGEISLLAAPDASVPEPSTLGLGLLGLAAVAGLAGRKRAPE